MNANVRAMRSQAEQGLVRAFAEVGAALPGEAWAAELRAEAARLFEAAGLPHRRVEEWKWTDLRAAMREALPLAAPAPGVRPRALDSLDATRLVFVNGRFAPDMSDAAPEGVEISSLSDILGAPRRGVAEKLGSLAAHGEQVPVALNTAFMSDGAVISVAAGAKVERPIHLAFVFSGEAAATYLRNLVVLDPDAEAMIVESVEGPQDTAYQTNIVTEILVGDRAKASHVKLQDEGRAAIHLATLLAGLGEEAHLETFTLNVGAGFARNQMGIRYDGENSSIVLAGTTLARGRQHSDTTLLVDHAVPHGKSRERFKSVLDDQSRSVFQGKIVVRPGAQKTDGEMKAQALFLSDDAEFDGKPELEIFADDVVCGHGATAGTIDEDQLFYLMARGIAKAEAEALLVRAFVTEAIEGLSHEGLRDLLEARADRWLAERTT